MDPEQIRSFYEKGFQETPVFRDWPWLWSKQYRVRLENRKFIKLHRFKPRLDFKSLRKLCMKFTPQHVYMSVLNWLMPERVGPRGASARAYPIGGEYVVDIDILPLWRPWGGVEGFSPHGFQLAKDKTTILVEKILENYRDVQIVFSGKRGFHVHVLDFEIRDWAYYDVRDPLKSHEVARFLYTQFLQSSLGLLNRYHFILSTDPMRMMTVPGTLNGETGKICFHVGGPSNLEDLAFEELLHRSDARKNLYNGFDSLHSHLEPTQRIRL